ASGVPGDDRVWRSGNRLPGPAGIDRSTCPLPWCDCSGLAVHQCWNAGHGECDHSIGTRQCVQLCARRELGDCDHVCASVAGEQPADFPAITRPESLPQEGVENGYLTMRAHLLLVTVCGEDDVTASIGGKTWRATVRLSGMYSPRYG